MKVFGIGLNKTGTKTLAECLRQFGFNHCPRPHDGIQWYGNNDMEKIFQLSDQYDSFEDWPWPLIYKILDLRYPDSRFILTLRKDPETWFLSLCKLADRIGPTSSRKIAYGYEMPHNHKDHHIKIYTGHEQAVRDYFKDKKDKLLVVNWEKGDGWQVLCDFLNIKEIPARPFPHLNSAENPIVF